MADNEATEAARKRLDEERAVRDKSMQEYSERMRGKPTPTQEENDLAALGATFLEHEDDGSGPDQFSQTRQAEAQKPRASYRTRSVQSSSE